MDSFRRLSVGSEQTKKNGFNSAKSKDKLIQIPLPNRLSQNPSDFLQPSRLSQQIQTKSAERRAQLEEEIERDYAKYIEEYGISKNGIAKALVALREKNLI